MASQATDGTCPACGQVHERCAAHSKRTGGPCGARPPAGAHVCKWHGGGTPQARAAAERRREQAAAEAAVATLGLPVDISPTDALLEEVRWTAGHVQWLRRKVQDLEHDDLVWGTTRVKEGGDDRGTTEEAKPNVWLELYDRERKHLVTVASAALKAGVEERKVRLAESQGDLLALVIRRILNDLQLTPDQQQLVGDVVPRHLRAIATEGATA